MALIQQFGSWSNLTHRISLDGFEITVRDLGTNQIVAYSSTKADFMQSLEEFATDFGR